MTGRFKMRHARAFASWSDSELLRYASLDLSWGALAFGTADPDATCSTNLLSGHAALVLSAAQAEATGQLNRVRALDAMLAAVPATNIAFAQAALLRADWRARVSSDDPARQRMTDEVVQLFDAALLITPNTRLYADRIWNLAAAEHQRVREDLQVMELLPPTGLYQTALQRRQYQRGENQRLSNHQNNRLQTYK
jgi:hypothetical protein